MITRDQIQRFKRATLALAVLSLSALLMSMTPSATLAVEPPPLLWDFSNADSTARIETAATTVRDENGLHVSVAAHSSAMLVVAPPKNRWDLSSWSQLILDVDCNAMARICIRVENDGATDWSDVAINDGFLHAGDRHRAFRVFFFREFTDLKSFPALSVFKGMNGLPGGWMYHWRSLDPSQIRRIRIELFADDSPATITLHALSAASPIVPQILLDRGDSFFPFVDRFGQYAHDDWPGKVHSDDELHAVRIAEESELAQHARAKNWDRFGGWSDGPQREATGRFHTEKIEGRWWLVDPDGHLFWSHGVCCVGNLTGETFIAGREKYFAELPADHTDRANFFVANLHRQFGEDWKRKADDLAIRRLQSWGMNTLGNWSDPSIEKLDRLPFVREIHLWPPKLTDNTFDVFDPSWKTIAEKVIDDQTRDWKNDPWCIGFFVDNEIGWEGNGRSFAAKILSVPGETFTKRLFVQMLRESLHDRIESLNDALNTRFKNWDAVLANKAKIKAVQVDSIGEVADAFFQKYVDTYFDIVGPAIKRAAPQSLYLGCRFNVTNDVATRSAARYCDVLSFNLYRSDVSSFQLPSGIDKPILISEFHFGALDRGQFHPGLQPATDQRDRADKYRAYVKGALSNKLVIGTHWFEYPTEALTARGDGENYNDGLLDVCNNPFPELRDAVRETSAAIYRDR